MLRAGVWNGIGWLPDARAVAFWFLVAGAFALLAGDLVDHMEARGEPLPRSFGWGLSALALVGAAALPLSGFWLLLAPGVGVLRSHRTIASQAQPTAGGSEY